MSVQILKEGNVIGQIHQYEQYKTQNRCTFRTQENLTANQKYQLKFDDSKVIEVFVTSAPPKGDMNIIVHASLDMPVPASVSGSTPTSN